MRDLSRYEAQALEHKADDLRAAGLIDYPAYKTIWDKINERIAD